MKLQSFDEGLGKLKQTSNRATLSKHDRSTVYQGDHIWGSACFQVPSCLPQICGVGARLHDSGNHCGVPYQRHYGRAKNYFTVAVWLHKRLFREMQMHEGSTQLYPVLQASWGL